MADPWRVPITALRRVSGSLRHERRQGQLGRLSVADSVVDPEAIVGADVDLVAIDGGVEVTGVVTAPFRGVCRRCQQPVEGVVEAEVRELYRPVSERAHDRDDDEETYELGYDHLDLRPLARDAVLLELPLAPLCRDDCRGLCPECGADLNTEPCAGHGPVVDDRWRALDVLRLDPETASEPRRN